VVKLATTWGSRQFENALAEIGAALLAKVKNEKADATERATAARDLIAQGPADKQLAKEIIEVISPRTPPELAKGVLAAVQSSDAPEVGNLLLDHLPAMTPEVRGTAITVLLSKADWTKAYLESIEKGKFQLAELS